MEEITIEVRIASIVVHDGRMKGSRLKYKADNLYIYVLGACPAVKRDKVNYAAFEACRARHIPLKMLIS